MRQGGAVWALLPAVLSLFGLLGSRTAEACAGCDSGDPTLTAAGTEQPFAGRLRSALELRYRTDSLGRPGVDQSRIREVRTDVSLAWAPSEDLFLLAGVPLLYRKLENDNLAQDEVWALGELTLRAKWFVLRDRALAPRWLGAVLVGLKFPTAPRLKDRAGRYLALEAQPGSGSLDGFVGPSLAAFAGAFSGYVSLYWLEPLLTRAPLTPGGSLRASAACQWQIQEPVALRVASDLRWEQPNREAGQVDPNSGGAIVFAGPDLLWSPIMDFSMLLGARFPILERLRGGHAEGPIFSVALVRDW